MSSTALILGEIAKMSLQAYFLACEQRNMTREEALKEIEIEYEGFKQRNPADIPDPE